MARAVILGWSRIESDSVNWTYELTFTVSENGTAYVGQMVSAVLLDSDLPFQMRSKMAAAIRTKATEFGLVVESGGIVWPDCTKN